MKFQARIAALTIPSFLSLAAVLGPGLVTAGCGSSSHSGASASSDAQGENVNTTAMPTTSLAELALGASLAQIDPANFPALQTPPTVTATGTPASGTATIDFGSGTTVNDGTISGTLDVTWTSSVSGQTTTATITASPSNMTVTDRGQTATITGTLTIGATITGTTATGTITGPLTVTSPSYGTSVIAANLTYSLDGATGVITLGGDMDISNTIYGDWTATFSAVTATVTQTGRDVTSGTIELVRNTFPSVTVTLLFTAPNAGTLTLSPVALTRPFAL